MNPSKHNKFLATAISIACLMIACTKSGGNNNTTTVTPPQDPLFPLAVGNSWDYKLKHYDTATGKVTDSSLFTLTTVGKATMAGTDYYTLQDPVDTTTLSVLGNINNTTIGSLNSA